MSEIENVVKIFRLGKVALIALNRPAKHNALSEQLMGALRGAFQSLSPDVRVVVLYGEGKSFCAGLDLSEHRNREPFESVLFSRYGHDIFNCIELGGASRCRSSSWRRDRWRPRNGGLRACPCR